ncbi:helix-turn-helix domain-containing protein [Xenophilus azovorans]|uniref:helix-turn-helix domain-containing protein n=1 Tax=Xenophilus azovorans TaxID=151755 RepID=UPI00056EA93F|nr:helix-turn-helix transcriptional regulator [Xenophilus azovorans]
MANIASVLKSEIARVARKEVRAEIESLKKASSQHRSTIAQLRRQLADLQRQLKQAGRQAASASRSASSKGTDGEAAGITPRRFSAKRLASHRAKLGLSAADYGRLVGMSGATIYNWEQGKSRPDAEQLQRLAAVRALGKRAVAAQVAALP